MATHRWRLAAVLAVGLLAVPAAQARFPKPQGYVNDFARVLDGETRAALDERLRAVEKKTSAEVVLATVTSLDGMSVEEYANRMFAEWGVGKKKQDNGVLVVVAPSEREMRIEVGYGLEGILPDGLAGQVIRESFIPRFRDDDYAGGVRAGMLRVAAIVEARHVLTDEERAALDGDGSSDLPLWALLPFLGIFVAVGGLAIGVGLSAKVFFLLIFGGLFLIPLLIGLALAFLPALSTLVPLAVGMAVFGFRMGRRPSWRADARGGSAAKTGSGWIMGGSGSSSSGSGSDWGSGGSSSSGGSFGGGSSGGGGASGRW